MAACLLLNTRVLFFCIDKDDRSCQAGRACVLQYHFVYRYYYCNETHSENDVVLYSAHETLETPLLCYSGQQIRRNLRFKKNKKSAYYT